MGEWTTAAAWVAGVLLSALLLVHAWVEKQERNARGERCGCGCDD